MNSACGEAPPNHRHARLQSCHICTPTENDLTGHLCKQPQFHFKIGSFLMVEPNIFSFELLCDRVVAECLQWLDEINLKF